MRDRTSRVGQEFTKYYPAICVEQGRDPLDPTTFDKVVKSIVKLSRRKGIRSEDSRWMAVNDAGNYLTRIRTSKRWIIDASLIIRSAPPVYLAIDSTKSLDDLHTELGHSFHVAAYLLRDDYFMQVVPFFETCRFRFWKVAWLVVVRN